MMAQFRRETLLELGQAKRTIFLCRYLQSETLRQEIQEALNVIERWNGTNGFIFFGKGGEVATNRLDDQGALTPLIRAHVNPYGSFELDLSKRLPLDQPATEEA